MRTVSLMVLLGMLVGCYAQGRRVEEGQLQQFERGKTSYSAVVLALGPPTTTTLREDGSRQVVYSYVQMQVSPISYVPIVSAFVRGGTSESTHTIFEFDPLGRLVSHSISTGQDSSGSGFISGGKQR